MSPAEHRTGPPGQHAGSGQAALLTSPGLGCGIILISQDPPARAAGGMRPSGPHKALPGTLGPSPLLTHRGCLLGGL